MRKLEKQYRNLHFVKCNGVIYYNSDAKIGMNVIINVIKNYTKYIFTTQYTFLIYIIKEKYSEYN